MGILISSYVLYFLRFMYVMYPETTTSATTPENDVALECTMDHEIYINCYAGLCAPERCEDLDESILCPYIIGPCHGGCICDEGYLRLNGECVKIEDCPPKPCRTNETWMSPCKYPCPYPHCPIDNKPAEPCDDIHSEFPCYPGCQCAPDYLRNSSGHCILNSECPPV